MHEVVTLQFGQQANYVGTHFWNTQVRPFRALCLFWPFLCLGMRKCQRKKAYECSSLFVTCWYPDISSLTAALANEENKNINATASDLLALRLTVS